MRLVIAAVVVFALTYALTDGLDLNTRWLFASFPLVMGALLGVAWGYHRQALPTEAYSLLTDNPVPVPPPARTCPDVGEGLGVAAGMVVEVLAAS